MRWALDTAYGWIGTQLETYAPETKIWLAFPLLLYGMLILVSITRSTTSIAVTKIALPAAQVLTVLTHALLLTVEFAGTQLLRAYRIRPPGLVYRFGDSLTKLKAATLTRLRLSLTWSESAFARQRSRAWSLLILLIVSWWNGTYCRNAEEPATCKAPPSAWAQSVNGAVRDFVRRAGW